MEPGPDYHNNGFRAVAGLFPEAGVDEWPGWKLNGDSFCNLIALPTNVMQRLNYKSLLLPPPPPVLRSSARAERNDSGGSGDGGGQQNRSITGISLLEERYRVGGWVVVVVRRDL